MLIIQNKKVFVCLDRFKKLMIYNYSKKVVKNSKMKILRSYACFMGLSRSLIIFFDIAEDLQHSQLTAEVVNYFLVTHRCALKSENVSDIYEAKLRGI